MVATARNPTAIQTSMEEVLEHELDEIRAEVEAQRRSDSWPAEVSDGALYEEQDYIDGEKALKTWGVWEPNSFVYFMGFMGYGSSRDFQGSLSTIKST